MKKECSKDTISFSRNKLLRNGMVVCKKSEDKKIAVLTTLCCMTDFTARTDEFINAANMLADVCLKCRNLNNIESLAPESIDGITLSENLERIRRQTKESIEIGNYIKFHLTKPGIIGSYVHFDDSKGSMVQIETNDNLSAYSLKVVAKDIAMHITAMNPSSVEDLLSQPFIKNNGITIARLLCEAIAKSKGVAEVKRYVRFEIN